MERKFKIARDLRQNSTKEENKIYKAMENDI